MKRIQIIKLWNVLSLKIDNNCVNSHKKRHTGRIVELSIFLLVHGQVNGQNPLVQTRFTCLKTDIFPISLRKHVVGTH